MKVTLVLLILLGLLTLIFGNFYLSFCLVILILLYNICRLIYLYNCKQVDAMINILVILNQKQGTDDDIEMLLNSMSWLQKYIYNNKYKK